MGVLDCGEDPPVLQPSLNYRPSTVTVKVEEKAVLELDTTFGGMTPSLRMEDDTIASYSGQVPIFLIEGLKPGNTHLIASFSGQQSCLPGCF